jgi:cysteinyl-tRNA synthetase
MLEHAGYAVEHAMNVTDVGHMQSDADEGEDKMTLAARQEARSPWDIAKFYESEFFRHSAMLNIRRPKVVCRATDHIPEMIQMIKVLESKGFAYESGGNVYFDIARFPDYSEFAGLRLEELEATERVKFDTRKRNQADFALWFSQSKFPGQIMKWDSPWGVGFPGWHIECSAMASKYLGERLDIHCGGIDHVRVHHTNEIAQSEGCFGHRWVNHWFHCDFLELDKGKMSKSSGEYLTLDDLVDQGVEPLTYRYLALTSHYRGTLRFTNQAIEAAANAYHGLRRRIQELEVECESTGDVVGPAVEQYSGEFWQAMYNDLRTPAALATLWATVKDDSLPPKLRRALILDFDTALGLDLANPPAPRMTNAQRELVLQREKARAERNWPEADRLRKLLLEHGVDVRDAKT